MARLEYNGELVYTDVRNSTSPDELKQLSSSAGVVEEAYFFKLSPDRFVERVDFNLEDAEKERLGLAVRVKISDSGSADLAVTGLNNIVGFLSDAQIFGKDLSELNGREVTEYSSGIELRAIGLK